MKNLSLKLALIYGFSLFLLASCKGEKELCADIEIGTIIGFDKAYRYPDVKYRLIIWCNKQRWVTSKLYDDTTGFRIGQSYPFLISK